MEILLNSDKNSPGFGLEYKSGKFDRKNFTHEINLVMVWIEFSEFGHDHFLQNRYVNFQPIFTSLWYESYKVSRNSDYTKLSSKIFF